MDIYHDHLLAKNWATYSNKSLEDFTQYAYGVLEKHKQHLPPRLRERLPSMMKHNWLIGYREMEGIETTFRFFAKRIQNSHINIAQAHEQLETDFDLYNEEFNRFFPDLVKYVKAEIELL